MSRTPTKKRDWRIRIERDGPSLHDGFQRVPGDIQILGTVWASYWPGGGKERTANAENAATAPAVFRIQYADLYADLGPGDRIRYPSRDDGALYDIKSCFELGRRDEIEIAAVRRARP